MKRFSNLVETPRSSEHTAQPTVEIRDHGQPISALQSFEASSRVLVKKPDAWLCEMRIELSKPSLSVNVSSRGACGPQHVQSECPPPGSIVVLSRTG